MRFRTVTGRAATLLGLVTMFSGIYFAPASWAATSTVGWIRFLNLSETLSPIDVYLVSPDGSTTEEAAGLSYGSTALAKDTLTPGTYTVDIRSHGASATSAPAGAVQVTVKAGVFYNVGLVDVAGAGNERKLVNLPDAVNTKAGSAAVEVINAAYQRGDITFSCDYTSGPSGDIMTDAAGGTATADAIPAGDWTETATAANGEKIDAPVDLAANTARTEIVLDTAGGGLQILNLLDTVGDTVSEGEVQTGLGARESPLPWLALIGAGGLIAAVSGARVLRPRRRAR